MIQRKYKSGFSLIELLIVVAIIAALIGVAVPYFQSNLAEAQATKAKQDLDTIRNAINLYESRFKPLNGIDIKQILGQTMNEIPNDPWGNSYKLDANIGIIFSYGADGIAAGQGADADIYFLYKPKLQVRKAEYEGPFGPVKKDNKITITFTKAYTGSFADSSLVIRNDIGSVNAANGTTTTFSTAWSGIWKEKGGSDPKNGILKLTADADAVSGAKTITPTMAIDLVSGSPFIVVAATGSVLTTASGNGVAGPGDFSEFRAIPAENGIGARVERKQ